MAAFAGVVAEFEELAGILARYVYVPIGEPIRIDLGHSSGAVVNGPDSAQQAFELENE